MNFIYYLPSILGVCVFFSMCAILATAKAEHRKKLLYIQLFPMLLLTLRFGPYLSEMEWRLVIRRPLDYVCVILPVVSILLGAHMCGVWKQLERWQARVSVIALISCFFMGCTLLIGQVRLNSYPDWCGYVDAHGEQLFVVMENTDPGSTFGRKYYPYVNEVFRGLIEVERNIPY